MSGYPPMKEMYLGCECMDLDHVALFIHFPPTEDGSKSVIEDGEDEPCVYLNVSTNNYRHEFIPPIRYFYDSWAWKSFFNHNWYKRLWIAGKHIAKPNLLQQWGILDSFDFQDRDLEKLDAFMSLISSDIIDKNISENSQLWISEDWSIVFSPTRLEFEKDDYRGPWQVGWEIQFNKRKFWGRVGYAFKYIFGSRYQEKNFSIHGKEAAKIRSMIKWVKETNKKDADTKKDETNG